MEDSAMADATHRVSTTVSYAQFSKLRAFDEWGVDMQLADVRDMLRLPLPISALTPGTTSLRRRPSRPDRWRIGVALRCVGAMAARSWRSLAALSRRSAALLAVGRRGDRQCCGRLFGLPILPVRLCGA
jgi:hypothetical protein